MTAVGEGLAANLASEASKGLFLIAKHHIGYCIHFRKHVENFHTELKKLESARNDALGREERARDNNQVITEFTRDWLSKAKDLIDDAQELKAKTEEHSKCCPNCIRRYDFGKKAVKMTTELNKHITDFKSDNFSLPAPPLGIEFYAPKIYTDLQSRREVRDQIWEALKDDQKLRVGVYGMGGSGKTTLVKELGYKAEKEKLFEKVVFVVVSNPPNVRTIQENIASQLGLDFRNNQESDRARELWTRLTKGEKILVILDDVWEKLDDNVIGIPFEDSHKGCRVLITTRMVDVCTSMNCKSKIQLPILSDEDSWRLFQKYADISNNPYIPLDVAEKIAYKCKGLPVAIATLASTLKDKEPDEWEEALTTLENVEPLIGIDEHLINVYHCLKLSYSNLKSKQVQELFLLCSFFPEDCEIPVEVLTRYVIGLHLLGDVRTIKKARRSAHTAIKTLLDSCLLLNAESNEQEQEQVKMHDLVREVAHWIADKEIKEIIKNEVDKDEPNRVRYLWLHMTTDLPNLLNYSKLEILSISIETDSFEEKEELFNGLDNLCVLILSGNERGGCDRLELPQSIQVLKRLRLLRFTRCQLFNISVIESLKSLEILELRYCAIDELPNGIAELENLKLLDLSNCYILLQNPFKVIGRIMQLEELYFFYNLEEYHPEDDSELKWTVDAKNICDFLPENCQWTKLSRYSIQIGGFTTYVDESIPRSLSIEHFHHSTSNDAINNLVRRAEYLCLYNIERGYKSIVPDVVKAVGGKIQWTKILLGYCDDIGCLIDSTNCSSQDASMLCALVELEVVHMDNLKELCHGTPPSGSLEKLQSLSLEECTQLSGILFVGNLNLRSLKVLIVKECPVLTSLFTSFVALSLELLEEIEIKICEGLEYIIADERKWEEDGFDQKINSGTIFGKLKSVVVWKCPRLKFLFPVCLARKLIQVEVIKVGGAADLKHIFGQYQDEGKLLHLNDNENLLPSLQQIDLSNIPSFDSIFPMYSDPKDSSKLEAASPTELHSSENDNTKWYTSAIQCLPRKLVNFCHIRCCSKVEATTSKELYNSQKKETRLLPQLSTVQYFLSWQALNMCHIQEIYLQSLPTKMVSLFTVSTAQKIHVKRLSVVKCDGLKHIITHEEIDSDQKTFVSIFPELRYLCVEECNLLEFIFPAGSNQCLAKLETLIILENPELKYVCGQCYQDNHLSHHQNEGAIHLELLALKELAVASCPRLTIKSINNIMICFHARDSDSITTKGIPRSDSMLNIEDIYLKNLGIESVFVMEGLLLINEQQGQLTSRLERLRIFDLCELRYICKGGPQQCLSFQNLRELSVIDCGKLRCIFSVSIARSLPQLERLMIENCNELEQMVEEEEDHMLLRQQHYYSHNNNVCFPKLESIMIWECNQLKYLFSISHSQPNEFPKLESLDIRKASQLEQVFRWRMRMDGSETIHVDDRDITLLPALKELILNKLPCLTNVCQGFNLETCDSKEVSDCPKLLLGNGNDTSSDFPESSDSTTQYGVTPVEEAEREEFSASRKSRDATAPQSSTDQAINMNENIHGTNGDLLAVPPSFDSTSFTSGEALIELTTSLTSPPTASSTSKDEPLSSSSYDLLLL